MQQALQTRSPYFLSCLTVLNSFSPSISLHRSTVPTLRLCAQLCFCLSIGRQVTFYIRERTVSELDCVWPQWKNPDTDQHQQQSKKLMNRQAEETRKANLLELKNVASPSSFCPVRFLKQPSYPSRERAGCQYDENSVEETSYRKQDTKNAIRTQKGYGWGSGKSAKNKIHFS